MAESAKCENRLDDYEQRRDLKLKSSAAKFFDLYRFHLEHFPKIKPDSIKSVEKIKTKNHADVWLWTFVDVNCGTWKHSVTSGEMTSVTWTLLEPDVPLELSSDVSKETVPSTLYRPRKVEYLFSPNGKGCTAHVKLTYGKKVNTVPVPDYYMNFICDLLKAADKYPHKH